MRPEQILPLWFRLDLGVMAMKGYFTLPRAPELESHHHIQFSVIPRISFFGGVTVSIY